MTLKKVRTVTMMFFENDGHYFKVWDAQGGGHWVDKVDVTGETTETVGFAANMTEATKLMEGN